MLKQRKFVWKKRSAAGGVDGAEPAGDVNVFNY